MVGEKITKGVDSRGTTQFRLGAQVTPNVAVAHDKVKKTHSIEILLHSLCKLRMHDDGLKWEA